MWTNADKWTLSADFSWEMRWQRRNDSDVERGGNEPAAIRRIQPSSQRSERHQMPSRCRFREEGRTDDQKSSPLTHAIRLTGIAPIVLLVVSLALHDLFPRYIPHWFQPIIDKDVAVLTLSAGHAAIIGLLISNRGRFNWSTYALFIAALATALAGFRTIGESTPGHVVALMLFLLTGPAVWAEWLSANTIRDLEIGTNSAGYHDRLCSCVCSSCGVQPGYGRKLH